MASRVISATSQYSNSTELGGSATVTYNQNISYGSSISNATVTGGTISITNYGIDTTTSFYFSVYINGSLACKSTSIKDANENYHTVTANINTSSSLNSSLLLTGTPTSIVVYATSSDSYVGMLGGSSTVTITVNYSLTYTNCTSPTSVKINGSTSDINTESTNVILTCSGASAGTNNAISAYYVQYRDSADKLSWGSWTGLTNMSKSQASSGYSVGTPASGYYRQFQVKTKGSISGYDATSWTTSSIVYRIPMSDFGGFTDPVITALYTPVKAIHITEMQDRVNYVLNYNGKSSYSFTPIIAGETKVADWTKHIMELRNAVDSINSNHEVWIDISVNCPRVDVMDQLRTIIALL